MSHKCEFEGCTSTETEHFDYPTFEDEQQHSEWLCWEHADKNGFCPGCHYFVAGSGDENWNGGSLCYECHQELAYEIGEYDDYDDYDDYDEDLDFFEDY